MASIDIRRFYHFFKPELQKFETGPLFSNLQILSDQLQLDPNIAVRDKEKANNLISAFQQYAKNANTEEVHTALKRCILQLCDTPSLQPLVSHFVQQYAQEYEAVEKSLPQFLNFK